MFDIKLRPGTLLGVYPQLTEPKLSALQQLGYRCFQYTKALLQAPWYSKRHIIRQVNRYNQALQDCSEAELSQAIIELRAELQQNGLQKRLILKAFAVIREAASRTLGKRHYDAQVLAGWIMINGKLAEMNTGEGKTLAASLPACTAALAGIPVHVITSNDYLAERDADTLQPLYKRMGLQGKAVIAGMSPDQCRQHYQSNIVHTTNKQIAFDYLRDRIAIGDGTGPLSMQFRRIQCRQQPSMCQPVLLRGLCFALIDEADSVLIDEANTPLIITKTVPGEVSPKTYADALYIASLLFEGIDYRINQEARLIELNAGGEEHIEELSLSLSEFWKNKRRRETLIKQALSAKYFYSKDKHYVITEDEINIIDEATGRLMPDRAWEYGLQQMIEAKEGCNISEPREPQARISYQRFFCRYLRVGGTSGTLSDVAAELRSVYNLGVLTVPRHRPCRRHWLGEAVFRNDEMRTHTLLNRIEALYRQRRPVLIGTNTVEESEHISQLLTQASIPHRVLNAKQDQQEAQVIAQAGQAQAITVATNMAGRGTDIELGKGVAELGGLHVIALNRNSSRRIDRQLYGRCARQGDPGSAEAILSLNDPALVDYYSSTTLNLLSKLTVGHKSLPPWLSQLIVRLPQKRYEKRQALARKKVTQQDRQLRRILAFSGKFE
ncbi:MAG: preprotein translocase subunit SecA [Pseudohongiellaceae bacterium]|jgi:preprotein translocase subunit SecA